MIDIEELKKLLLEKKPLSVPQDVIVSCHDAAAAIESLQTELSRKDGTIGIISNALSHAEHDCAIYRSRAGELENENRRLKLDLEEATQAKRNVCSLLDQALEQNEGLERELARLNNHIESYVATNAELAEKLEEARKSRQVPNEQFAIVMDRSYDGEGLSLAVHDGINYVFTDGDCYDRDGDTLDGYTAEFLTDYQLERKLEEARKDAGAKQAEIDRLMLEFCPDEMTAEQKAEWAAHQRAARQQKGQS